MLKRIEIAQGLIDLAKESGFSDGIRTALAFISAIMMNQPRNVVEIGSYHGFFACCAGTGIADSPVENNRGHVWTIDINPDHARTTGENAKKLGLEKYITPVTGDGLDTIKSMAELSPIDFLFVDGDHTPEGVYRDIIGAFGYVSRYGLVLCHDYAGENTRRGIDKAFFEIEKQGHTIDRIYFNIIGGALLARKL